MRESSNSTKEPFCGIALHLKRTPISTHRISRDEVSHIESDRQDGNIVFRGGDKRLSAVGPHLKVTANQFAKSTFDYPRDRLCAARIKHLFIMLRVNFAGDTPA